MLQDVSVNRVATATKVIRVDADTMEEAIEKALELARDEDFSGCVVDYDFDAYCVANVQGDPNPLQTAMKDETCVLCGAVMPDIHQAIDEGWIPSFFDGEEPCDGPVCNECVMKYMEMDESGETVLKQLKGEYVSEWATGQIFRSPCTVNILNHTIVIEKTFETYESVQCLEDEYVMLDGKRWQACPSHLRDEYTKDEQKDMLFWG